MRYKIIPRGGPGDMQWLVRRRAIEEIGNGYTWDIALLNGEIDDDKIAASIVKRPFILNSFGNANMTGVTGQGFTNSAVNPVLEFEVPFYNRLRYIPGKIIDWVSNQLWTEVFQIYGTSASSNIDNFYDVYVAASEDFAPAFWTGMPPLYYEPDPPLPA